MAEAIERETGHWPLLIKASGGIFEVRVEGKVVVKKTWMGFPTEDEVLLEVKMALARQGAERN